MMKRLSVLILTIALILPVGCNVIACNEEQTNTYVTQVLFGDGAFSRTSDANVKLLMDALYLCCEQSDNQGQDKIDHLKQAISGLPDLTDININNRLLIECSHNRWEITSVSAQKQKSARKKLLKETVEKVFDFGFFEELFEGENSKYNSFAAMLYYTHILADYLADDPAETMTNIKGVSVPAYSGTAAVAINGNRPSFTETDRVNAEKAGIIFCELDKYGRAGKVLGYIGPEIVGSVGKRERMADIRPSGWNNEKDLKYQGIVNSQPPYLYNRCHLLAHQLGGKEKEFNLVTGTRYLNETGMKPYEDMVASFIGSTGYHVLYRATPVFKGENALVSGVQLEAYSIEDEGQGVCFNVYCYNVQPGVDINYRDGSNQVGDSTFGVDNILPFATYNASESNPDLILEMNKHLEILFKDQKGTDRYTSMMNAITMIASEARIESGNVSAQSYMKMKKYEYEYFDKLKSYVPLLLEREDFFTGTF